MKKTLAQIEALFEALQEGVVVLDTAGATVYANQSSAVLLETTKSALMESGSSVYLDIACTAALSGKVETNSSVIFIDRTGFRRVYSVTAAPPMDKESPFEGLTLVTFRDVTQQLRGAVEPVELIEKADSERATELERILNSVPAMIGYFDKNELNINSNHSYAKFFGMTPRELKGRYLKDLQGPALYEKNEPFIRQALSGESRTFERELNLADGKKKHVLATYIPDKDGDEICGFFIVVTDISLIKNLEDERRAIESKLIASSRMSLLGEMASGVAHEINNPLAIIGGATSLLKEALRSGSFDEKKALDRLDKIEITVERIAKIVRGLRTFARDAEKDPKEIVSVDSLISETLELCRERARSRNVAIRAPAPTGWALHCNPTQVSQILMNLLSNATDAVESLDAKWIELKLVREGSNVVLTVTDSGSGIEPQLVAKMMAPFFTTKAPGKGTGLGLSISKSLAEENGGQLNYVAGGPNTCFSLTLPEAQIDKSLFVHQ